MEVVEGDQAEAEDFFRFDEMTEVGSAEILAGITGAFGFNGAGVLGVGGIFEVDGPGMSEGRSIAGQPGWQDTIKHVNAPGDHFDHLRWGAEAHGITAPFCWKEGFRGFDSRHHFGFRFADTHAANRITIKVHRCQFSRAAFSEVGVRRPLNDSKNQRAIFLIRPPIERSFLPAEGEVQTAGCIVITAGVGRAFVKGHDNIRAEVALDLHRLLRADEGRCAVNVVLKMHAFLCDPAKFREREHLKAAAVGEDRTVP